VVWVLVCLTQSAVSAVSVHSVCTYIHWSNISVWELTDDQVTHFFFFPQPEQPFKKRKKEKNEKKKNEKKKMKKKRKKKIIDSYSD
jgi:hypothetical protein